jgi:predicted nucleic-acid-binding Zn-ribbon protein
MGPAKSKPKNSFPLCLSGRILAVPWTRDDYATALKDVGAKMNCPSCGATVWNIIGDVQLPAMRRKKLVRLHLATCDKCGYARFHAAEKLEP